MRAAVLLAALTLSAHAQWTIQKSDTTADLRGIDNVGHGIAWASGTNGTVLHTTDNGATWLLCKTPPDAEHLDFRGIQAFDANTAIVMSSGKGDLSRLYKTTDGCQAWKLVFTNPDRDGFWDAIRFTDKSPFGHADQRFGVLVGDPVGDHFQIYFSYDFGTSWELSIKRVLPKQPHSNRGEALFAASNSAVDSVPDAGGLAFVTGGAGGCRYFHLVPGGLVLDYFDSAASFEVSRLRCPHASSAEGAFSMAHHSLEPPRFDSVIVGGDYLHPDANGYSAFVPAANYSWFTRHQSIVYPTTPPHGYRSSVAYDATTKTWITVGPNGTDISTDDGRNWRALKPSPADTPDADQHWNALSLPFVVGPKGRIGILRGPALGEKVDTPKRP
jgi:photosystem II stability/assembly factor-like uncharacterized protein